jgi:protein-tyrosine phosphatase
LKRLCFVCWGNICRSPTAAAIMSKLVREAGVGDRFVIDSAGVSSEEVGNPPDRRAVSEARRRGVDLDHRAWQFRAGDFARFDLLPAADQLVADRLRRTAPTAADRDKVRLLRSYDPAAGAGDLDIADPWYGRQADFAKAFDLIEAACAGLLADLIRQRQGETPKMGHGPERVCG